MSKSAKILIILIIAAIGLLTYLEASEPNPINWFPSYAKTDKIPLGTFAAYELIEQSFKKGKLKDINQPPYEFLADNDTVKGTYFFVNGSVNFGKDELNKILKWVEKGNTLFISSKSIEPNLLDTLTLKSSNLVSLNDISTKPIVELTNTNLKNNEPYLFDRDISNRYFKEIDTTQTIALGVMQLYNDTLTIKKPSINYVKHPFGDGTILLHTFPEAFTNYFILKKNNYVYTQNVLTYINPKQQLFWDNHYKAGKTFYTSPLFLLFNSRSLKWAYYFIIIGTLLFVLFEGKRKQRSIPIITPLKNQTLAFTRTISGMYFEKERHKEIATKQNLLFLDYVRSTLRVPTDHIDTKTLVDISARSDNDLETTTSLFEYFDTLNKKQTITKEELSKLYNLISEFKN